MFHEVWQFIYSSRYLHFPIWTKVGTPSTPNTHTLLLDRPLLTYYNSSNCGLAGRLATTSSSASWQQPTTTPRNELEHSRIVQQLKEKSLRFSYQFGKQIVLRAFFCAFSFWSSPGADIWDTIRRLLAADSYSLCKWLLLLWSVGSCIRKVQIPFDWHFDEVDIEICELWRPFRDSQLVG